MSVIESANRARGLRAFRITAVIASAIGMLVAALMGITDVVVGMATSAVYVLVTSLTWTPARSAPAAWRARAVRLALTIVWIAVTVALVKVLTPP